MDALEEESNSTYSERENRQFRGRQGEVIRFGSTHRYNTSFSDKIQCLAFFISTSFLAFYNFRCSDVLNRKLHILMFFLPSSHLIFGGAIL